MLFSCTSYTESKNIDNQKAQKAHSEFSNLNNNLSYQEYKSLIVEYGKSSKFPDMK
tara:strand:- start:1093 stop:1260 length:168 start_codon:yes stop_codon:yes gene_type:complete